MKSVPKLIRRFVGILLLSSVLILVINFAIYALLMISQSPDETNSPYNIAVETGRALKRTDSGYTLSDILEDFPNPRYSLSVDVIKRLLGYKDKRLIPLQHKKEILSERMLLKINSFKKPKEMRILAILVLH